MSPVRTDTFDWTSDESASAAVVRAVAEARGVDATEVEPLYDAVDPDALDVLFPSSGALESSDLSVEFRYGGYRVRVDASGEGRIVEAV